MVNIPEIPLEAFEVPTGEIESKIGAKNDYVGSLDFGVVGSGQCGGRLAKSFYDLGYKKTLALNTAMADLKPLGIPDVQKLFIGGLEGSGKDMAKGERATKDAAQAIFDKMREVFGTVDKIILSIGFGGGTGSGGLLTLIEIAKKYLDALGHKDPAKDVIVVAALPTSGELKSYVIKKNNDIIQGLIFELAKESKVGPVLLIDNSKIERLYRGIPPAKFWITINDTITSLFQTFNYLSLQESNYTSFDKEDYKTVLSTSGLALMGVNRIMNIDNLVLSQALQDNLKKTLLADIANYETATEAACVIVADEGLMGRISMDIINQGFDAIHNLLGSATVHRGLYDMNASGIKAYTLVCGMKPISGERNTVY